MKVHIPATCQQRVAALEAIVIEMGHAQAQISWYFHSKWLVGVAVFLLHQFSSQSLAQSTVLQALREARSDASASTRRSRVAPLTEMLSDLDDSNNTPHITSESVPWISSNFGNCNSRFWNVNFRRSCEESICEFPSFSWGQLEFRKRRRIWMIQSVPASTFGFMHMHSWMMFQVLSKFGRLTFQHVPRHGRLPYHLRFY